MNILNTLTLRSLKLNRKRTIVTIIGIILSAAMICGTFSLAASFQDLFVQRAIRTDGNFHATFHDVKPDQTKYITDNAYTKTAMLSRDLGFARFEESAFEKKPYFFVKEYDAAAFQHMPVNLTAGRFPEKAGEILLSEEILQHGGGDYQIGDTITFDLGERIAEDGQPLSDDLSYEETEQFVPTDTKTYTITGLMAKPHFENFSNIPGFTVVTYLEQGALTPNEPVNVSILGKNARDIYNKIPEMAENAGISDFAYNNELLKWMGLTQNDSAIKMIYSIAAILAILIAVGSIIVIYNSFAISVSERKKQFGMLASTGATPEQIRKAVFFEGALLGLVGLPIGILSGIGGIGITLSVVNRILSDMMSSEGVALRLVISPSVILATILFVGLIILFSAYLPAKRASATSPIEAIRLSKDINIKGKTVKTSRLTRSLFGFEGELALKNLKRSRRRYRATVISLMISIILFISISTFTNYGLKSADLYYQDIPYDINVVINNASVEDENSFYQQVTSLEGVEEYSLVKMMFCETWLDRDKFGPYIKKNYIEHNISSENEEYYFDQNILYVNEDGDYQWYFNIITVGEPEFKRYASEKGLDWTAFQDPQNFKGILVNKNTIETPEYVEYEPLQMNAGEKLQLTGLQYDEAAASPASFSMEVSAVTDTLPLGVSYANPGEANIIVSEEVFAELEQLLQDIQGTPQLYICSTDSTTLADRIRTIYDGYADGTSLFIYDVQANRQGMQRSNTVAAIFLYGFLTLITLIGVTNIFNTISTNVALRRSEFAMLKSVGLTPKGFNKLINYECIFYGLKALLYGLPISILISMLLYKSFGNMFQFTFFLPWKEAIACVIGVFLIIFITMLQASSKLKDDNIIDALKEENL